MVQSFRQFLLRISGGIVNEHLSKIKFLCKDRLSDAELESVNSAHELLDKLCSQELIKEDNTEYLQDLLNYVGLNVLAREVEENSRQTAANDEKKKAKGQQTPKTQMPVGIPCKIPNFVGRDDIVCSLADAVLVKMKRLLILKALPGAGKSAVAIQLAHYILKTQQYHGYQVVFVCLREQKTLACVCRGILHALDVTITGDPVSQTRHVLERLSQETLLILDNTEDIQKCDNDFAKFIQYLRQFGHNLQILLTSRLDMEEVSFDFSENLPPLDIASATDLLIAMTEGSHQIQNRKSAAELAEYCGQMPLLIEIAAKLVTSGFNPKMLAETMKKDLYKVLNQRSYQRVVQTVRCLLKCVGKESCISLIKLSMFSSKFNAKKAEFLFKDVTDCNFQMCYLNKNALIQNESDGWYSLHPLIQTFCREEKEQLGCLNEGREAERKFNEHQLELLLHIHKKFVSRSGKEAMQEFFDSILNIKQALKNCLKKGCIEMKKKCIDTFNDCVNTLGKVLNPNECLKLYKKLHKSAVEMKDEKRVSECLISVGFRHMCDKGHRTYSEDAFGVLKDAYNLQKKLRLHKNPSETLAHCCSKLGLCYILKGERHEGLKLINDALTMREEIGDQVLIAASYCDKASSKRFSGEHSSAIYMLKQNCLGRYKESLGDHPWVATIHSYIADSHIALGEMDEAVKHRREALRIRQSFLGDHLDTARSLGNLGKLLCEQGDFEGAREAYEKAYTIQKRLDMNEETVATFSALADVYEKLGRPEESEDLRIIISTVEDQLQQRRLYMRQVSQEIKKRTMSIAASKKYKKWSSLLVVAILVLVAAIVAGYWIRTSQHVS
ncbi:uncharacterized protein LOC5505963 isoform X2 [Nematostella vectensis]|uniref:uncharacterized protein LOC5505963 isoform X2 n=1 Tax=Nematostella vectensis TaxID=45351 RepID=UPI0020770909|nr:uncharacterized protein LOC5505963 isoform X2 [Nematostella vectensis]